MIDYIGIRKILEEKTGLAKFNSGKTNIISYCPWCELDSTKNHGHLYLECIDNQNQMPVFHCFKCEDVNKSKGTLVKLLRYLRIDPRKYISEDILNSKSSERNYDYYKKSLTVHKHKINTQNFDLYRLKKQYIISRLGYEYNIDRIPRLIFNIREFLRENKIDLKDKNRFIDYYEKSFIGFVSDDGTMMILRNIDNNSPYRYVKLALVENKNFFKDLYTIKSGQTKKGSNTIILCEGIFDLLVAINNIELQEVKNKSCIWASVLGCGYMNAISSALDRCKLTSSNVIILSDRDKNENYYWKIKKHPSVLNLEVNWNKYNKDFGKLPIGLIKKYF